MGHQLSRKDSHPSLNQWDLPFPKLSGLASNVVRSIYQSSDGCMWFGTSGGVSRYDPFNETWQTFTQLDGLASNVVRYIYQSQDGNMWFATSEGVSKFEAKTGKWRTFADGEYLASNLVRVIHQTKNGVLWFGTALGISYFDPLKEKWYRFTSRDGLVHDSIYSICESRDGLWFGTWFGVSFFNLSTQNWQNFASVNGLTQSFISAIIEDDDEAIWFSSFGKGIRVYLPSSREWKTFNKDNGLISNFVRTAYRSIDGTLWFGTTKGVSYVQPRVGKWESFSSKDGLTSNFIRAIHQSKDGNLWFGTLAGVNSFSRQRNLWKTLKSIKDDSFVANDIQVIHQGHDDTLWFGIWGNGVIRLQTNTGDWRQYTDSDGLVANFVRSICRSIDHKLWFGTYGDGVSSYDPNTNHWQTFTELDGLANNLIRAVFQSSDGALWFASLEGVSRFQPNENTWFTFNKNSGLADQVALSICQTDDGDMWFGTPYGVTQFKPENNHWQIFNESDGLVYNFVSSIQQASDGAIWFGTGGGVSRFNPSTSEWQSFTKPTSSTQTLGLASNTIRAVLQTKDGAMLFGTLDAGLCRFDYQNNLWSTFTKNDGLADNAVLSVCQSRNGQIWLGTAGGVSTLFLDEGNKQCLGAIVTIKWADYPTALVVKADWYAQARMSIISLVITEASPIPSIICKNAIVALACAPESNGVWSGEVLGGLQFYRIDQDDLSLYEKMGLPSNHVTNISPIPNQSRRVWVGTAGGAARVIAEENSLRIEKTATCDDGNLPTGPVDAIVALADGSAFLAYNNRYSKWIFYPEYKKRRAISHIRYIPDEEEPSPPIYFYRSDERLNNIDIRSLTMRGDTLWASASAGLFKSEEPCEPGAKLQLVSSSGSPQAAIRRLKTNLETNDLWMIADAQQDVPARVIGYDPITDRSVTLGVDNGIPAGLPIHDLDFTDEGELVVLAGSLLFKGFIRIGEPALIAELRADINSALPVLAELLGMNNADQIKLQSLQTGVSFFKLELNDPEPLREQTIPLFGLDSNNITTDQENSINALIQQQLVSLKYRPELPFFIYCRDTSLARRLTPYGFKALVIDEAILRELLSASNPQQTLSGLLFTRGLLATLSPYRTEGAVHDPSMFYGRTALLDKLMQTQLPQFLLVGPRRIGKSSLLRRLESALPIRSPELDIHYIDLLGIKDSARATRLLAHKLKLPNIRANTDPDNNAVQLAEVLREKFDNSAQTGLILLDEVDGLVETDAGADFPLLSELRSLQAEGICSFVLAGYWYLYRRTLDYGSPVHNFASVERLGPLDIEAARNLIIELMARLGVSYVDEDLPTRIAELTGGYPSLIQFLCDQMLEQLKQTQSLLLTADHLEHVQQSSIVRDYLSGFFRFNTGSGTQILVYQLLQQDGFSLVQAHEVLENTVERAIPLWVVERILLQLVIFGLVEESAGYYQWAIPLVRNTLLSSFDLEYRVSRLVQELGDDFAIWITPSG